MLSNSWHLIFLKASNRKVGVMKQPVGNNISKASSISLGCASGYVLFQLLSSGAQRVGTASVPAAAGSQTAPRLPWAEVLTWVFGITGQCGSPQPATPLCSMPAYTAKNTTSGQFIDWKPLRWGYSERLFFTQIIQMPSCRVKSRIKHNCSISKHRAHEHIWHGTGVCVETKSKKNWPESRKRTSRGLVH